jgi:hypothetical protein
MKELKKKLNKKFQLFLEKIILLMNVLILYTPGEIPRPKFIPLCGNMISHYGPMFTRRHKFCNKKKSWLSFLSM